MTLRHTMWFVPVLAISASAAAAQTTVNAQAQITVGTVLSIGVTNTSVTFPTVAASHFDAGSIESSVTSVVTHKGNVRHSVTVLAGAATMTGDQGTSSTDAVRSDKPASDLQWKLSTGSSWNGLSNTTAGTLHSNAARGNYADDETVQYRMLLNYATDTPGQYTLSFTYTIAAS